MRLSVVIPARDEQGTIGATVRDVATALESEGIDYEVLVVDDHSRDRTAAVVDALAAELASVRYILSPYGVGFGLTVRAGLERFEGDAVAILMADGSDDPHDLVRYHRILLQGYDCVFGSRFIAGARVRDYPKFKLVINRVVNLGIRMLFRHGYNDTTNAFKAYRREVIQNIGPLLSNHFNLTVEMPLKAIIRGRPPCLRTRGAQVRLRRPAPARHNHQRVGHARAERPAWEAGGVAEPTRPKPRTGVVHWAISDLRPLSQPLPAWDLQHAGARAGAARTR
jgi:glycosyltransferase involved in cell wall biosynthesis